MTDAPKPTIDLKPFILPFEIKERKFNLKLSLNSNKIIFLIEELNTIPPLIFEKSFTKEELEKISQIFKIFNDIKEAFEKISEILNSKTFESEINEQEIKIIYKNVFAEFSFIIPIKENQDLNQLIRNLYSIIKDLKKQNESNNEEIKNLKDEIKEIKNKLLPLKEEKDIEEKEKEENFFYQSTILTSKEEKELISNWIKENTKKKFKLLYRASKDGDLIKTFHEKCDNKGPTVMIIKTNTGFRFGGYNPLFWDQSGYKKDILTFIFSLDKKKKYTLKSGHEQYSVYGNSDSAAFGSGHDIGIFDQCTKNNNSYINTPYSFNTTEKSELSGGQYNITVSDYEVYSVEF